ncbi:MAG: ATP-dependent helicase HrpB [Candidatus Cryptobacteroides sp.]
MARLKIIRQSECTPDRLPAAQVAEEINNCLKINPVLVVTAPPGAGKSTLLPITVLNGLGCSGKVLMLEPRRVAARQIAERIAYLLGEPVGQSVGYRIRFENKVSDKTMIEVVTEGILTRMLTNDPTLDGVSAVIFDEFHERSLASDLALALVRESFRMIRPDLRIIIMSATIDAEAICKALGAPLVESKGRMFPVTAINSGKDTDEVSCASDVARMIRQAHSDHEGDILGFLPGEGEIRECARLLGSSLPDTEVMPLYGMLSSAEQKRAISPLDNGKRKVVLATPIAETSITIEGVKVVVDSGLCRRMKYDPQSGLNRLETVRISMDMARQRAGRAGRTAPGTCYRLWTTGTERRMTDTRVPEIIDADLCSTVLDIAAWGGERAESLQWLTPPPKEHLESARRTLEGIGALSGGKITPHGRDLAAIPCHPRISHILMKSDSPKDRALAADIAAIIEEKDPLAGTGSGIDLCLRVEGLRRARRMDSAQRQWARIIRIAEQYRSLLKVPSDDSAVNPYDVGRLVAAAYPERIAQSRGYGRFLLSGGEPAKTDISDPLAVSDYLAIASINSHEGGEGKIFLAAVLSSDDIATTDRKVLGWDSKAGRTVAVTERRIGRLVIDTKPLANVKDEDVMTALCEAAPKYGLTMFDFNERVQNLQRRVAAVSEWHPEMDLPDLSTENVLARSQEWLPMYAGKASTVNELRKIDMEMVLWNMLSYEQQQTVGEIAPSHIEVPTGSRIRVEYRQGADAPIVRVRLQECFGMKDTPRVDKGKRPVIMELLSPGFKPVQLTSDLKSFWTGTYYEVRKELRMRYPKHSWPENPLEAEPVRGALKRK